MSKFFQDVEGLVWTKSLAVNGKAPIAAWVPSLDTAGNGTNLLTDLSRYGNNGTLTNMDAASDWVADTGAGGVRALDFDGVNDFVSIASPISYAGDFTVSSWYKHDAVSGAAVLFGETSPRYGLVVDANNLYMALLGGATNIGHGGAVTAGNWINYFITRSGSTVTWYVNGILIGTRTLTGTLTIASLAAYSSGTATFDGRLDDFRTWDQSLDATDMAYLYDSGNGRGRLAA